MNGPIVVGTDGSETASLAVARAIELARTFRQPLHVVAAYHPQALTTETVPSEFVESVGIHQWADVAISESIARARSVGVKATGHAVIGSAADAILDVAASTRADLVVVGSRGISSKSRFVLGNVPSKVVHHATCSVHVVHTC